MELQLEAWHKLSPGSQEEVSLTPTSGPAYKHAEILHCTASHRTLNTYYLFQDIIQIILAFKNMSAQTLDHIDSVTVGCPS